MKPGHGKVHSEADRDEKGRDPVLADVVDQYKVLPLPEDGRERLILKTPVGTTARGLERVDGTSDHLKEPAVILVLQNLILEAVVHNRGQHLVHEAAFSTRPVVLPSDDALTEGCAVVEGRPQSALDALIVGGCEQLIDEWPVDTTSLH